MKAIKRLTLVSCILGALFMYNTNKKGTVHNDILIENVEALSQKELWETVNDCNFFGEVECPIGGYAEFVFCRFEDELVEY